MEIIKHRRNSISDLTETSTAFGVEVDIRSHANDLIIHHDPYSDGVNFETWLESYKHGTLILNVKEEGLEKRLINLMKIRGIEKFFFLDQSFPFLVKTSKEGESRCALRISEYESIETALNFPFPIEWLWLDCFTKFPLDKKQADLLKTKGYKLCVVSPELQGRSADDVMLMRSELIDQGINCDAVCTKYEDLWL